MGQKVNPLIFRSKSFPIYKNYYNNFYKLNIIKSIENYTRLKSELQCIKVLGITFKNSYTNKYICSILLTSKTQYYNNKKYLYKILIKYKDILYIRINVLKQPLLSTKFILNYIISQYTLKKVSLRKLIKQIVYLVVSKHTLKGMKFLISGRINGVQMAKTEVFKFNEISLHKVDFYIEYDSISVSTKYGLIGFKI